MAINNHTGENDVPINPLFWTTRHRRNNSGIKFESSIARFMDYVFSISYSYDSEEYILNIIKTGKLLKTITNKKNHSDLQTYCENYIYYDTLLQGVKMAKNSKPIKNTIVTIDPLYWCYYSDESQKLTSITAEYMNTKFIITPITTTQYLLLIKDIQLDVVKESKISNNNTFSDLQTYCESIYFDTINKLLNDIKPYLEIKED